MNTWVCGVSIWYGDGYKSWVSGVFGMRVGIWCEFLIWGWVYEMGIWCKFLVWCWVSVLGMGLGISRGYEFLVLGRVQVVGI